MVPFHEFLALGAAEREGRTPYILALTKDRTLQRITTTREIVQLAEERQLFWSQLRQLAGLEIAPSVRASVAASLESDFERRSAELKSAYESQMAELRASVPAQMARQLAGALLHRAGGSAAVADFLASLPPAPNGGNKPATAVTAAAPAIAPVPAAAPAAVMVAAATASPTAVAGADDDEMVLEAWIDSARCTTCNECTNLNKKMFAYNADKQATIKDAHAGTFAQLVTAAERCPVSIIHPGTPLDPKEKDLPKWVARGAKFN